MIQAKKTYMYLLYTIDFEYVSPLSSSREMLHQNDRMDVLKSSIIFLFISENQTLMTSEVSNRQ